VIITYLLVNYHWIDATSITVGATDNERWSWELESGYNGADAFSFVQATITETSDGYAPSETIRFLIQPGYQPHRTIAERAVGQLCAIAWEIKDGELTLTQARERFFGRKLDP
jgi:hypothetical protein